MRIGRDITLLKDIDISETVYISVNVYVFGWFGFFV